MDEAIVREKRIKAWKRGDGVKLIGNALACCYFVEQR
jgi:predicted GIY-YIG superfamily endonuclease